MEKDMSLKDIIDSEHKMVQEAGVRYGESFQTCLDLMTFTQKFLSSVKTESCIFTTLYHYIRKHITLSFLSALRRHHVQSCANLRQVLEATVMACYAMAHPKNEDFVTIDGRGIMHESSAIKGKKYYNWIEENYPDASEAIRIDKELINRSCAHCNLAYAAQHCTLTEDGEKYEFNFFDRDDNFLVKGDLWSIGHTARNIMDIFYGINKDFDLLTFKDDFIPILRQLQAANEARKAELMSNERFKRLVV